MGGKMDTFSFEKYLLFFFVLVSFVDINRQRVTGLGVRSQGHVWETGRQQKLTCSHGEWGWQFMKEAHSEDIYPRSTEQ